MKIRSYGISVLLLMILFVPCQLIADDWSDHDWSVVVYSPVCSDVSLLLALAAARNSDAYGQFDRVRKAEQKIYNAKCRHVYEGDKVNVDGEDGEYYKVSSPEGVFPPGYVSKYALENKQDVENERQRIEVAIERKRQEAIQEKEEQRRLIARYNRFVERSLESCKKGYVTGLMAGEGGLVFSPIDMLKKASVNAGFRESSLSHGLKCVIEPSHSNSYCTGITLAHNEYVTLSGHGINLYGRYGNELDEFVSFVVSGKINGVGGLFRMYALKDDFKCE
ncbi:hypothetical protein [Alloalcanivorax xenomutans]|uniref:hypothetical protein n=1 Tax=Alloalcanivorax xenomutans TaxID=1094342 RepID=UPI0024E233F4|nr:hypothetical protein [Alloalcanivorax xenomutans]